MKYRMKEDGGIKVGIGSGSKLKPFNSNYDLLSRYENHSPSSEESQPRTREKRMMIISTGAVKMLIGFAMFIVG